MRRVKLGTIIRRVRSQLDIDDGDHVQDADILDRLTSGLAELYSILDDSGGRFREKRSWWTGADMTAATEDNADERGAYIKLPSDFGEILGVDQRQSTWYPLEQLMVQDRNDFGWSYADFAHGWELRNDRLYLHPAPKDSRKFRMLYAPAAPQFDAVNDEPDDLDVEVFVSRGEEFLIWYCVAQLKDKTEEDWRFAVAQLDQQRLNAQKRAVSRALRENNRPEVYDEYSGRRRRWGGEYDY